MPAVQTPKCPGCKKTATINVTSAELMAWQSGVYAQDAFPNMAPEVRERFITGYCNVCWDKMFPDEEE